MMSIVFKNGGVGFVTFLSFPLLFGVVFFFPFPFFWIGGWGEFFFSGGFFLTQESAKSPSTFTTIQRSQVHRGLMSTLVPSMIIQA